MFSFEPFAVGQAQGGICEKNKFSVEFVPGTKEIKRFYLSRNTGIVTFVNYNRPVPQSVTEVTFCHELGHNFGSPVSFSTEYLLRKPVLLLVCAEVLTALISDKTNPTRVFQHDTDPTCAPGDMDPKGNFIMFPSATRGTLSNNVLFSPCSIANISAVLKPLFEGGSSRENCFQGKKQFEKMSVLWVLYN